LAESTDALVIVVSEEKGRVSVAKGTDIRVVRQKDKFREILQNHVGVSTKHWGGIKKEKLELAVAAVVSFIFIAGVWFSFSRGMDTLMILDIPIEYMNRPPEMEILSTSANAVSLELSGSGALMRSLKPDQLKVRLDLAKGAIGANTFTITPENVSLPPGVFLKDIQTDAVQVTLDVPVKKQVPVQIDWAGTLPGDLLISEATYDPQVVQVLGSKRILDKISTVYTEKVSVDGIRESGTVTAKLALNPASLRIAPGSKDRVTINYVVKKRSQQE
jgi:YbbR domain-containing protein